MKIYVLTQYSKKQTNKKLALTKVTSHSSQNEILSSQNIFSIFINLLFSIPNRGWLQNAMVNINEKKTKYNENN